MFTVIVENKYGERLELTHNPAYAVAAIDGIDPPEATINTTRNANYDGAVYNSSYMNIRTITITLAINKPAEINRINLYRYFKSKGPVRMYYKNGSRDVYIDGYVKSMQIGFFDKKQTAQIVIDCPRPHFNGSIPDIQEFSSIASGFEFPFDIGAAGIPFSEIVLAEEKSILNHGDLETGVLINIHALGAVNTPKIYNVETMEHIILNVELAAGDDIYINTIQGEKSITVIKDGTRENGIKYLDTSSTWLQMLPGDNVMTVDATSGPENMLITFTMTDQFEGV